MFHPSAVLAEWTRLYWLHERRRRAVKLILWGAVAALPLYLSLTYGG